MITAIEFRNFKVLQNATLPLGRCTILVGPNGSGKSTVLQGLEAISGKRPFEFSPLASVGIGGGGAEVEVRLHWDQPIDGVVSFWRIRSGGQLAQGHLDHTGKGDKGIPRRFVKRIEVYSLDADSIAAPVSLQKDMRLAPNGHGLAGVLTRLQDSTPERFEALNRELSQWLPEFDRIMFDVDGGGHRILHLRTREGGHRIAARDLSQGTLLALAILTLAYLPEPPSLVAFEEPDRGIHPRLLRHVQDALYRLAYPESQGEKRQPVQVLATTHSPYFLDLFKDHPEEIVIASRAGQNVQFERLSDKPDIQEILAESPLGEIWFTGILGGVPTTP